MTKGRSRDWWGIGCAAVVGASLAFPAGLIIGGKGDLRSDQTNGARRHAPSSAQGPAARDVYSPRVIGDPYVIEQQRRVLKALEASCRGYNRHCVEAEQARLRIEEAEARK